MFKPQFNKHEVLVFRQFQRKGYALFACLGREVVISVLSVATLEAAGTTSISDETWRASDDSTKTAAREVMLDDVSITGSRAPLTVSQAARMVTVLSREDIAQAPVQSINDLLKMAVGIDVRQRGPLGSQTDISIRGGTQEQIIILLNGINISDPQTAHNTMDLPCDVADIVRIEVLEGPAGRTYGTSSLVGAINIVTSPRHGDGLGEVRLEGGSYGYAKASARVRPIQSARPWQAAVSGSYARSDGYTRSKGGSLNTDFSGSKAFYQGAYDDEQVKLSWHMGISDKGWGSGTFYATPKWQADEQYEHTTKTFMALQGENRQGQVHLQSAVYWQQNRDRYEGYRGRPEVMKYNYNRCDVYGLKLNSYFDWKLGRTAFGAELRNEDLVSGNLGEALSRTHHIKGTDRDYTQGINRTNISAHLEHNVLLKRLTISAGFVAAKSSWSNMNMTLYPGIDMSYQASGSIKLFASYNSSLRLPSFTEMYYKLQGYAADPHLKPEEMQAIEVGARYNSTTIQSKATLYHHHGKDMIDWIMDTRLGSDAQWQSVNHTKVNTYGMEANVVVNLSQWLNSRKTSLALSYSYIHQDKDLEPGVVSQYALEYLRHKLVGSLQTSLWSHLTLRVDYRWQDRVGSYTTFSGDINDYTPYALVDTHLEWSTKRWTVFTDVNNVMNNHSYVDFGNVAQPGRWIVSGVKIKL